MAAIPPIRNPATLPSTSDSHGEHFAATYWPIGHALGLAKLGCRMVEVAPGKKAWPYHLHHANEELFVIVAGQGTLRYDGAEYPVQTGDVVGTRAGPGTAHQIINTSDAPLRYLAISTMIEPEVSEYPDSGKLYAMAGAPPGGDPSRRTLARVLLKDAAVDYWLGER